MPLTRDLSARLMQLAIAREEEGIQSIIDHHNYHRSSGKERKNKDGTSSTVVSTIISDKRLNDGRETVIPLLWEGKQVSHKEAIKKAIASGRKWPSAATAGEAHMLDMFAHSQFK